MKILTKLAQTSVAILACAVLCSSASAQIVTILDFGSSNNTTGAFEDANGDPLPDGQNLPYNETVLGGNPSDPAPVAFNGYAPNDQNSFNVVVGADPLLETDATLGTTAEIEAAVLNGGAVLEWTNVASWNLDVAGHAGEGFFASVEPLGPTTFTITTANPGDTVSVEAIGSWERDALVTYNGTSGTPGIYTPGTAWTFIGTSTGSASGTLEVANQPGGGDPEGNVGAFRITITPAVIFVLKGDVDLNGVLDLGDIAAFIGVLQSGVYQAEADCDCSGAVDFADIPVWISFLQAQ